MSNASITTIVSPATSNKIMARLFKSASPLAIEQELPLQDWTEQNFFVFTGLTPSTVYLYNIYETDTDGNILQQYTKNIYFTTPASGSIELKDPVNIIVDETPGLVSGTTSTTFADWIGWKAIPELIGAGTMYEGVDYSYNIATGVFTLLPSGSVFVPGVRYYVRFEPRTIGSIGEAPSVNIWSARINISTTTTLTAATIGKKVILSGSNNYFEVTLPDVEAVTEDKLTFFETTSGNAQTIAIISANGNNIDWLEGARSRIYICRNENIAIYYDGTYWRVHSSEGNFKTVGQDFHSWKDNHINAVECNGNSLNRYTYARLYEDCVLKQNPDNIVTFDGWIANQLKFSYSDPDDLFRIPDTRGYMQENYKTSQPGTYLPQSIIDIRHHLFTDGPPFATGIKTETIQPVSWSSNHEKGNQDYDMLKGVNVPTLGLSGPPLDATGAALETGTKIKPERYTSRHFIYV